MHPRPILDTVRPPPPRGLCSMAGLSFPDGLQLPPILPFSNRRRAFSVGFLYDGSMTSRNPTREEAWAILSDHVKTPSLLSHALAVEAVMRHIARKKGADEELWGGVGPV